MPRASRRETRLSEIKVSPNDFIVDVGGGHRPYVHAHLVFEKYPFQSELHRSHDVQFPDVPLIVADAVDIPIADGGCDLLFSSHCIEHLPDPALFVKEIKRCAKTVFLEFPSRNRELMFAWNFHLWLIEVEGTTLKFYRNDIPQLFGDLFHREYDASIGAWGEVHHDDLNTTLYCDTSELNFEYPEETATEMLLRTSAKGDARLNFGEQTNRPQYSLKEILALAAQSWLPKSTYEWLARPRQSKSTSVDLPDAMLERLICLQCREPNLKRNESSITCACGASYARNRGLFDFDIHK